MKSNREIRREAWGILRGRWFWRLVTVGMVLNLIGQTVNGLVQRSFREMNIQTWGDFLAAKFDAARQGLGYAVPSQQAAWQMTGGTSFQMFVAYIFAAILAFGFSVTVLKATRDDEKRWFSDSFGGFRRPLEVMWLMVLMNLRVFLWSLVFLVPGIVAAYRYRQAWYLKSENPDWSAARCLKESGQMMKGHKGQAFALDLSYLGWFVLTTVVLGIFLGTSAVGAEGEGGASAGLLSSVFGFASVALLLFVLVYYFIGRAVFYRSLKASAQGDANEVRES